MQNDKNLDTTLLSQSGESYEPYIYIKLDQAAEEGESKLFTVEVMDQELKFNNSKEIHIASIIDIKNPNFQRYEQSTMDINSIYYDDLEKGERAGDIISPESSP